MSENLYAPPRADLGPGAGEAAIGTGDFEIARCVSEAWAATRSNFPLWLVVGVIWTLAVLASAATVIGIFLALPVLMWGMYVFFLRMHDGGAAFGDAFGGFSRYGEALGGMLGFLLVSILIAAIGQVPSQIGAATHTTSLIAVGFLVNLGVTFFVATRINFAPFLMVDRDRRLGEALRESWASTDRTKWKVGLLLLATFAVVIAGLIAFLIGVIPASVMAYLMWVSAYRQIFGRAPQP